MYMPNCSGDKIPRIEYTPQEIATWATVWDALTGLYPKYACKVSFTSSVWCGVVKRRPVEI